MNKTVSSLTIQMRIKKISFADFLFKRKISKIDSGHYKVWSPQKDHQACFAILSRSFR